MPPTPQRVAGLLSSGPRNRTGLRWTAILLCHSNGHCRVSLASCQIGRHESRLHTYLLMHTFFMQDNHVSDNPLDVIVVGTGLQIACIHTPPTAWIILGVSSPVQTQQIHIYTHARAYIQVYVYIYIHSQRPTCHANDSQKLCT